MSEAARKRALERYANDLEYRENTLERNRLYKREKRANAEYAKKELERFNTKRRERYATDPEYAAKVLQQSASRSGKRSVNKHRKAMTREQLDLHALRSRARYHGVTLAQFLTACPSGYAPRKQKL